MHFNIPNALVQFIQLSVYIQLSARMQLNAHIQLSTNSHSIQCAYAFNAHLQLSAHMQFNTCTILFYCFMLLIIIHNQAGVQINIIM